MATILEMTTVVRDGSHNAFTDLIFWQGCYWVCYRKGSSHVSLDGQIIIAVSSDRTRFQEVAHLKVPGDNREARFMAMPDGRLALTFPSWIGGHGKRHLQQFVTFSDSGFDWETPQPIYQPHWWLWRLAAHGGQFYSAAYTYRDAAGAPLKGQRTQLLVSDDMVNWRSVSVISGVQGGESALHFFEDGELWVVTRNSDRYAPAFFSVSKPPYDLWQTSALDAMIHAPNILEHEGRLYLAGRRDARHDDPCFPFRRRAWQSEVWESWGARIWQLERGRVTPVLDLPACGDCSYCGFIKDPDGRICLTYYSEHAYFMGIVPETYRRDSSNQYLGHRLSSADVYFAELEL